MTGEKSERKGRQISDCHLLKNKVVLRQDELVLASVTYFYVFDIMSKPLFHIVVML